MSPEQIDMALNQVEYKPGWKLTWHLDYFGLAAPFLHLVWKMRVVDAYDPTNMVELSSAEQLLATPLTEEGLVRETYRLAERAEVHEARKFFKYKGQRPFDPHKSLIGGPPV